MSKPRCFILSIAVLLAFAPSFMLAQAEPVHRPISITFVPGFGSNGPPYTHVTSNFSLNIIGGLIGNVEGCEIGSVFNIDKGHVAGFQIAGVGNFTGGDVAALQFSGVVDVVGGGFSVAQFAGVANVVRGDVTGGQVAGVANVTLTHLAGLQLGGVINFALGDATGAQIASTGNIVGRNSTVQIGVVNIAPGETYTQVGVLNIAGHARGLQLGVVNIARDHSGVPIGVASIVKNGQFHVNAWVDGNALVNVGLKFGAKHFYNVLAYGYNPLVDGNINKFGLGLGGHIELGGLLFLDIDGVHYNVVEGILPFVAQEQGYAGLTEVRLTGGLQITPRLAIVAGPTLNIWYSSWLNGENVSWTGLSLADLGEANYTNIWLGFNVGVQLF
jgi:hypothetical protein